MQPALKTLDAYKIKYELIISSASRMPDKTRDYVQDATKRGACVFIASCAGAAHLAGFIAAYTIRPVLGVPMGGFALLGLDSLFSTVQMPAGVPVATLGLGKDGGVNAAFLAMQILALSDANLAKSLANQRKANEEKILDDSRSIEVL